MWFCVCACACVCVCIFVCVCVCVCVCACLFVYVHCVHMFVTFDVTSVLSMCVHCVHTFVTFDVISLLSMCVQALLQQDAPCRSQKMDSLTLWTSRWSGPGAPSTWSLSSGLQPSMVNSAGPVKTTFLFGQICPSLMSETGKSWRSHV